MYFLYLSRYHHKTYRLYSLSVPIYFGIDIFYRMREREREGGEQRISVIRVLYRFLHSFYGT